MEALGLILTALFIAGFVLALRPFIKRGEAKARAALAEGDDAYRAGHLDAAATAWREAIRWELAEQRLAEPPPPGELGRIREAIEAAILAGDVTPTRGARTLGLSLRTLQRRLTAAGQTYSGLLQEVRLSLACRYLRLPDHAIIDVAFILGYAEVTSFHRAFKRWTGLTPDQYRLQPVP